MTTENASRVYGPDTVAANLACFWFPWFHYGNFDVKDASLSGRPFVGNIDKMYM